MFKKISLLIFRLGIFQKDNSTFSVSENKVLCHPSSVDSIPTSCNQEDHVSMGGFAARKALTVIEHVEAGRMTLEIRRHRFISRNI